MRSPGTQLVYAEQVLEFFIGENSPSGQSSHALSEVLVPLTSIRSPGLHEVHAEQLLAFAADENNPVGQSSHTLSELLVPLV